MRKQFAYELYDRMAADQNIFLVVGDLGYGLFDRIRSDMPGQFINAGAAEQCMMGVAVGLAMSRKVAVVYSITPFLLWRAAETVRNYINREGVPVKLVGSGRGNDYLHDGFSHWAGDDEELLRCFPRIVCRWPSNTDQVTAAVDEMFLHQVDKPFYLNLKR